jgi:uncharacterized protein YecT (DUF1311 family)
MRGAILSIAISQPLPLPELGPARAQSNPGDLDCKAPQTQMAMNLCAGHAYQAADEELNRVWAELRARRGEGHSWDPILEAQRLWIPFRDAHCEASPPPMKAARSSR